MCRDDTCHVAAHHAADELVEKMQWLLSRYLGHTNMYSWCSR